MSVCQNTYRYIVSNALTLYYTILILVIFAIKYVKNPFRNPWAQKLKLEPPVQLTDPKYGVHKYLKVNNIKLHYVESGDTTKPLMIFLHGFPEFWYSWRHQIVEFKNDYWCVAVDFRGYADSERPEGVSNYKIELLIEDVRDLIRQLGREKCILVSHDWGGLIANEFRDVYPDAVSALIMLASTSREAWLDQVWNNPAQRKKSWYVFLFRMPAIPERLMLMNDLAVFKAMPTSGISSTSDQDLECYKYWFRKPYAFTPPINYYRANVSYSKSEKYLKENIPMLVVHAADDPYLGACLLESIETQYAHVETTVMENVGHFLQQEDPERVNKCIREFLAKHNL